MKKLTLTYYGRFDTDKEGKPLVGKFGPYAKISIKAKEYGDRYLSGYENKETKDWAVGKEVEVESVEEVASNGKTYLNFKMPKKADPLTEIAALRVSFDELKRNFDRMREAMAPVWKEWNARQGHVEKKFDAIPGMNEKEMNEVNSTLIPDFDPQEINFPEEAEKEVINF